MDGWMDGLYIRVDMYIHMVWLTYVFADAIVHTLSYEPCDDKDIETSKTYKQSTHRHRISSYVSRNNISIEQMKHNSRWHFEHMCQQLPTFLSPNTLFLLVPPSLSFRAPVSLCTENCQCWAQPLAIFLF